MRFRTMLNGVSYLLIILAMLYGLRVNANLIQKNEKAVLQASLSYLIQGHKFEDALKITDEYIKKFPDDMDIIRLKGVLSYLGKDYTNSVKAYRKVIAKTDGQEKIINLYLLAQAYLKQKKFIQVEKALLAIREVEGGDQFSKIALRSLNETRTIPELKITRNNRIKKNKSKLVSKSPSSNNENKKKVVTVSLAMAEDSNPVFAPDTSSAKNNASSTLLSTVIDMQINGKLLGTEINNAFNIGYTNYQENSAKDLNNFRLLIDSKWSPRFLFFKRNKLSFENNLTLSFNTYEKFDYYYGSDKIKFKKEFAPIGEHSISTYLDVGYQNYNNKNLISESDNKNGPSYGFGATHSFQRKSWAWLNNLDVLWQKTSGKKFNTFGLGIISNLLFILPFDFESIVGVGYSKISYPNYDEKRNDNSLSMGIELIQKFAKVPWLKSKLAYARVKNDSDLPEFTYTQEVISIWLVFNAL